MHTVLDTLLNSVPKSRPPLSSPPGPGEEQQPGLHLQSPGNFQNTSTFWKPLSDLLSPSPGEHRDRKEGLGSCPTTATEITAAELVVKTAESLSGQKFLGEGIKTNPEAGKCSVSAALAMDPRGPGVLTIDVTSSAARPALGRQRQVMPGSCWPACPVVLASPRLERETLSQ